MQTNTIKLLGLNLHTQQQKTTTKKSGTALQFNATTIKLTVHFTGGKPGLGLGLHANNWWTLTLPVGITK